LLWSERNEKAAQKTSIIPPLVSAEKPFSKPLSFPTKPRGSDLGFTDYPTDPKAFGHRHSLCPSPGRFLRKRGCVFFRSRRSGGRRGKDADNPRGGLRTPAVMQRLPETTKIACFALSRPFLARPHLVKRWESGDLTRAKCLACNHCWTDEGNYCTVFWNEKPI